jgi:hypothetical protein
VLRAAALVLPLLLAALPAAAQSTVYEVRWAGIRIATATINGALEDGNYAMTLDARYRVLVWSGTVSGRVEGRVLNGRLVPRTFRMRSSGSPANASEMDFEGGAARNIRIEPPLPADWNNGRVPLRPEHQRGVLDPMSAIFQMAFTAGADPESACGRTLPVFTGTTRVDIGTSPRPTPVTRASARASEPPPGPSCTLSFMPVAGHRPVNATIRALQAARDIRVEFDAEATGAVRLLRSMHVPKSYGTLSIEKRS